MPLHAHDECNRTCVCTPAYAVSAVAPRCLAPSFAGPTLRLRRPMVTLRQWTLWRWGPASLLWLSTRPSRTERRVRVTDVMLLRRTAVH